MSAHVVVMPDAGVRGRWHEAFADVAVVAGAAAALAKATAATVLWVSTSAAEAMRTLRKQRPDLPLVAMTLNPDAQEGLRMFEAGASGYCHALAAPAMLQQVDIVVRNGGLWVGPDLMARAVAATGRLAGAEHVPAGALDGLTLRERDVAEQVALGASNREIAERLGITPRTVKAHMGAIFDKLGVRDRLQLVLALRKAPAVGRAA